MIPASDTQPENNDDRELWNIIEKQRTIILELQKALNEVTLERDNLLAIEDNKSPIPPPRSPFRSTTTTTTNNKKTRKDLAVVVNGDDEQDELNNNLTPIQVKVKSIRTNSFVLAVINNKTNKELWKIEKLYTDLLSLDMAVNINFAPIAILSLKNNKLDFLFSNTSSLEKRWHLIEEYITSTLLLLKKDSSIMYSFLIDKKIIKKGYLTKRTMQGGKKYYFVMNHSQLNYFHKKHDQLWLGTIQLDTETRIGKQKQSSDSLFLHAFIILNSKIPAYKYILCAESDTERDEWVKVLHAHQSKRFIPRSHSDNSMQPTTVSLPTIRHKTYQRSSMDDLALLKIYEASNNNLSSKISADSLPNIEDLDATKKKSANRKTFWSRKKFFPEECIEASSTSSSSTIATPSFQVFGVSLEEAIRLTKISKNFELPAIVYRCIEYLEAKDAIFEEGIYRQSGSSVQINLLRQQFCEYGDVDLLALPQTDQVLDVNVVASLLKMWLRELPVNVLTHELLNDFLTVIDEENKQTRIKKLGHLVSMLPIANYSLLRTLIAHLIHIVHHADHNKMTLRNVGIVFAPTLSIPSGVFTLFMSEFDYIFWTRDKPSSASTTSLPCLKPSRPEPSTSADRIKYQYLKAEESRSSRNSVSYKNNVPQSIMTLETKVKYHPLEHDPFMKEAFFV
ncbi:hypothetical protein HPULCUR_007522 [Helicostylum pulchrum]|uniref:RhoGAP-domain-containing protein n=1 Tax=Helicostylum pulchrum TaxID=562976 RepID=A0ABP9Y524_9FUNG